MPSLKLKTNHKAVTTYYAEINNLTQLRMFGEGAVSPAFAGLLRACATQFHWTLVEQYALKRDGRNLRVDGALVDAFNLVHGYWEAKDSGDDLAKEVQKKLQIGYPRDNILFQAPQQIILWQNGREVLRSDIRQPAALIDVLRTFFEYQPPAYEQWEAAVGEFKGRVTEIARGLLDIIERERRENRRFIDAFTAFTELCRKAINPNLSPQAVEEMLIQHMLTERIFRTVFANPDFVERNVIAHEIEKVVQALTARQFSRSEFLKPLDRFYLAIERTAATIDDFSQKQAFLNTVYENFFQGFSVKVADTHGIVYTPQPIVEFMVRSVEEILQREFGRSLSDRGVHILDPFVGTGNFMLRVMRQIKRTRLEEKYRDELHCNEVMLLPYYIAAMNIEHSYYELTGHYAPFDGICLVDTFELAEEPQAGFDFFSAANSERVQRQQGADIFVVIGNPPYNAGQVNENDNNKNRKYPRLDRRVSETYAKDSAATNKNALSDVYVKAFRWASDRIGEEGIVTFVTNNSYVDSIAFDGMRKHLAQDFHRVYIVDLKGNIRQDSMRDGIPLGEAHTVFGLSAMVGISVIFLVRGKHFTDHKIFYSTVDFRATRVEKFMVLEQAQMASGLEWKEVTPDKHHTWLTEGMQDEFDDFISIGNKDVKAGTGQALFENYGCGVATCRDAWAYNFDPSSVEHNMTHAIECYNDHVTRWLRLANKPSVDDFVTPDPKQISWGRDLKKDLQRGVYGRFEKFKIRQALYRPFTKRALFFDKVFNEEVYQLPQFLPTASVENENLLICVSDKGHREGFNSFIVNLIPDFHVLATKDRFQCFPFYTYAEDGSNRRENITDWALAQFQQRYPPSPITQSPLTKWDIFHYVYALLHHPDYRTKYAANLRRELPRLPFVEDFWGFAQAGAQLALLHVGYESQPEYRLDFVENPAKPLDWRVERMKLNKDKTSLVYNDFLTLAGIPPQVYAYKLGNRAALEWVIDQYQVSTDKRSGIVNDPNNPEDPQYIVRLIGQVITVSLATVALVNNLPPLAIRAADAVSVSPNP